MIRKLFLLAVMAVSAFALSASTAAADGVVVVENPGMYQIEGELTISIMAHVSPTTEVPALRCENHWDAQIDADGTVDFHDIDFAPHVGHVGNCPVADDCNNSGWAGQVDEVEPSGLDAFTLHTTICVSGPGLGVLDGTPFPVECAIDNNAIHCDHVIIPGAGTPSSPRVEFRGELTVHSDNGLPGIMHD